LQTIDHDFYDLLVDFWLVSFIKKDQESLTNQQFIENKKERIVVSDYLKEVPDLSALKKAIYEGGLIGGARHLGDETNVYDRYSFFTLSNICTIFWLLEDNPNLIEGNGVEFADQIKIISNGLKNSNSEIIVDGFLEILKGIRELNKIDKPNLCESVELHEYPILEHDDTKKFVDEEVIRIELERIKLFNKKFDVFKLFNEPNDLLAVIVSNIYYFLRKKKYTNVIGVERSGIPLASLVAYEFDMPLHILRTVPELKLLPNKVLNNKAVIIDDISISGTNLNLAKNHLKKNGIKSLKTLVLVKDKNSKTGDNFFINKNGNDYSFKTKFRNFKPLKDLPSLNNELKPTIKNYCVKNGYWYSEYAYCNGIFHSICDEFISLIEKKQIKDRCLIISTSTFGLPFASVLSYKLKRPLYLFSRRPNLLLDFNQKESLRENLKKGFTSIAIVDDVFNSGISEEVAENKLKEIAKDIKLDIHKFVIVFLGDNENKPDNLNYIIEKSEL